ncbi:MAG: 1-deoxy-D-xylulose-5-phosphate reductoisomerase [Clostridia bacterium]|nr:1-deoxy-D-xylulose-5-phosphate reductoisomerase [Clostridia bacterium]
MNKKIAVLGSTGSVGTQVLDVCEKLGARVTLIAAKSNIRLLEEQIRRFKPGVCAVEDEAAASLLAVAVADTDTKIVPGYDGMCESVAECDADLVYNAVSGKNGLLPTLAVLGAGKTLALANKESMVLAGKIVNRTAKENGAMILPVDSEHCAIFQCLKNGRKSEVKRIILTCSGGPFFGRSFEELEGVTVAATLDHPTWSMGRKITVDSATLANKGLEIIEAMHLFGVGCDMIKVLIHRQSVVHSMVEYIDNSVIAQLSVPDMRLPGQYALTYPERSTAVIPELDLTAAPLTFCEPDVKAFPMLSLARHCAKEGGLLPCAYNAANEAAVDMYLRGQIGFNDIYRITEKTVQKTNNVADPDIGEILECDKLARCAAYSYKETSISDGDT